MRNCFFVLFMILVFTGTSLGGGFGLYEFGARASSLSGAVVAQAADASSVFYNPAGLAFQSGTQFYGSVTLIKSQNRWVGPAPIFSNQVHEARSQLHTPLGIYLSHTFENGVALGLGVTNPFGLGLAWEDDFPGRVISKDVDLKSFYFSPVVAFRIDPHVSIGGGVDIVYSTVKLQRHILFAFPFDSNTEPGVEVGEVLLEANSKLEFGFAANILIQLDKLSFGFLYRHKVKNKFEEGDATFTLYETPFKTFLQNQGIKNQKGGTEITYPSFFSVGAHYMITDALGVEVDYMWYKWDVFKELVLDFDEDALDTVVKENYKNSSQFRIGLHYSLINNLELRLGYIYDQTPQPIGSMSPLLPDSDRNDYSIGLGYRFGSMKLDAGYMLVNFSGRSTIVDGEGRQFDGFDGSYSSKANLLFFSYGISF